MSFWVPKKGQLRFSERKKDLKGVREMDKNALVISKRLKFPWNDRTDKKNIAQPKMNLQSFKGTPDSLT